MTLQYYALLVYISLQNVAGYIFKHPAKRTWTTDVKHWRNTGQFFPAPNKKKNKIVQSP